MADSIPGNTTSTKTLEIGASDTSSIDFFGDTDWWKVNLVYGYRYQVWIDGYFEGQGTLVDPYLAVYSGAGVFSFANNDADSLSFYSYAYVTPSSTGYLFLSAEENGNNATGSYRIIIWQDELASTASAATIAVNSVSSVGQIGWQGDTSDWYQVTLTAGVQYQFDLIGSAGDSTAAGLTLADSWLYLRNSSGISLIYDNDSGLGLNARIFYTPSTSGKYYLDAQALSSYSYGSYRLIVNAEPTTAVLDLGVAQTGSIDFSGNVNLYSLALTAGVAYGFSVDGSTLADPYLELLNSAGAVIDFDDDSGAGLGAYLIYTPTVSGTYYLAARESGNNATGTYSARVWQLPTISIADAKVTEGNSGSTNMVFTLSLSAASPVAVTLSVSTSGTSTATSGIDFQATTANVTIAAGQTAATFLVPVVGDFAFEPTEVFYATISNAVGAVAGLSTGLGRIVDNDSPYSSLPTDSSLKYQWHLYDSTGINVFSVWPSYTGRGIRVAVYDWGVDAANLDLNTNVLTSLGRKASDLSIGGAPILTSDNHGTAVAGVIAAAADDYENVGVAFNSKIVSIYNTGAFAEVANAFTYAQNFDILNNSWGTGTNFLSGTNWAFVDDFSKPVLSAAAAALKALADNGRGGLGTIVVQSAGNAFGYGDDTNLHNFQNSRYIITVGATDYAGGSASYSSPGSSILVSAPGGDSSDQYQKILTADRTGANGYSSGDYTFITGTSFSSPIVAGIVALMLEANPRLGYRDIQEILAYSARSTDTVNNTWRYNGASDWNGGGLHYDAIQHDLGFGLVDALAAVRLAETWGGAKNSANVLEFSYSHSPNVAIPDYKASTGAGSVYDYISVTEDMRIERVEVSLKVTHTWVGDLYVLLSGPTGATSFLISRPGSGALSAYGSSQDNINFTLDTVLNWGESAKGRWQIGIFDQAAASIGTLDSWTIKFIGSPIVVNNTYIYTNEFAEATADQSVRGTLTDTSGTDTLNASAVIGNLILNLGSGGVSTIDGRGLTMASSTVIENAYGGDGNDRINGSSVANTLYGMRGNDTLDGGAGADSMFGGTGSDTYWVDNIGDIVTEASDAGDDSVVSWISYVLPVNVEGLILQGSSAINATGNGLANLLYGNDTANSLNGGDGNDVLSGGAGDDIFDWDSSLRAGNDTMYGGLGNDTYVISDVDEVIELAGEGVDTIYAVQTYSLTVLLYVENLTLFGALAGNITGNSGSNTLKGNSASNLIEGKTGDDNIDGGAGADTAVFSQAYGKYTLTSIISGWVIAGPDGADTLTNMEFARFSDQTLSLANFSPTGSITISGTSSQGQALTVANTLADLDGLPVSGAGAIVYQWRADTVAISGATGTTFQLTQVSVGKLITVTASYTDGHATAESKTTRVRQLIP